ncbi:LuxR C-terminal-related transcriptional regulator, partial [Streptomyces sp. NPDC056470]|uniref:LuxR C-terminal-related transcriptional regulator n=1 Tax=Streptomyces sp. NPDC056470 TaxID=3345831 RepID=UPI0036B2E7AD
MIAHTLTRIDRADAAAALCGPELDAVQGVLDRIRVDFTRSAAERSRTGVADCAERFEQAGAPVYSAEAWALASGLHHRTHEPRLATAAARRSAQALEGCGHVQTFLLSAVEAAQPLSRREKEIAFLAAAGRSSHEIAEQLTLSIRTVDNHLYRLYRKLGVDGRRDLRTALGLRHIN